MKTGETSFGEIVDTIYKLPMDEKIELKNLLDHNIAEQRREEIYISYQAALKAEKKGKLKFSTDFNELKKML